MGESLGRARPPQVLLGVGGVLLVSAGGAVASTHGGLLVRALLVALAGGATWFSLRAANLELRSSQEVLAVVGAGLAVAGISQGGPALDGDPVTALLLAAGFLVLHRAAPFTAAWPLVSWAAFQLAVLRAVDLVPDALHTELYLCVSLLGLGIALFGRRIVGLLAMITTAPWWLAGVVGGSSTAWADDHGQQWLSAALMITAGFGLLLARLREPLDPLLGPPVFVPVVAGVVAGAAVTGAFSSLGSVSTTFTGYAGVLLANLAAAYLTGWRRGLLLPVVRAAGIVMAGLCLVQLLAGQQWGELSLLLVLTAIPTALVAVRRSGERPIALPTTVGCLTGAVVLALPGRHLSPVAAAVALTVLYGIATTAGAALHPASRRATARAAAVCAVVTVLLLAPSDRHPALAVALAIQALCTLGWAWRTEPRTDDDTARAAWKAGAAQLVLAAWVWFAAAGHTVVEWYSLPAAVGLLITAGPELWRGASWPTWGPWLLVAAVPSAVLAVTTSDARRAVTVLVVAAAVLVAGARTGVRAPLMVGAGTALALGLAFTIRALPWPLGAALVVGAALLAVGTRRERRPIAGFGRRLADLR